MLFCDGGEDRLVPSDVADREREKGEGGDILASAEIQHPFGIVDLVMRVLGHSAAAARYIEHVLQREDWSARQGLLDLSGVDIAEGQMPDLALGLQRDQRVERF